MVYTHSIGTQGVTLQYNNANWNMAKPRFKIR